jgi:hypothetical protein
MNSDLINHLASARCWVQFLALAACISIPVLGQTEGSSKPPRKPAKNLPSDSDKTNPSPPPEEIELARLDHHHQLLQASLGPLKTALSKLDELALTNARAREYEAAIAARIEREHIATDLDRIAKELLILETRKQFLQTSLLPDHILLPLDNAKLESVRYEEEKKWLTHWDRPGAHAEWTLPSVPPGGYEVLLTYQCSPLEGGTIVINEKTFSLSGEMDTTLRGPEVKNLGTLKITDSNSPLRLTARTVVKSNLMNLLSIELIPANR